MNEAFQGALERGVAESNAPGAALFVGESGRSAFLGAAGFAQLTPVRRPAQTDTIYDLASLTKVVATTSAIMLLRDAGELRLDQRVSEFLPIPVLGQMTIEHLLRHTAGFTDSNRFYKLVSATDELISWYANEGIEAPPGERFLYDDAAFILLGRIVEIASLQPLDAFCAGHIFAPLGMADTSFKPGSELAERCASTENCPWRNRVITGEVHDENAFAVGGVSGHAGLFSTAQDLGRFCFGLMKGEVLSPETVREITALGGFAPYPWQGIGWELDPWESKTKGHLPARAAFGHTGWTGTSMWLDPERMNCVVLLSNTPHPERRRMKNGTLRAPVHAAVAGAFYKDSSNAHSGLDRLMREDFGLLRGKRYALLTNHASADFLGRGILDVLAMAPDDCSLVRIFSPEHGLTGTAEAGEHVQSGRWKDIPVISLYSGQRSPEPGQLADIDLFVVDLQDVGSRYYTYHATMKGCLAACQAAKVPVAVLDRPNPLGGAILEGPIPPETTSIVCAAKIPVRHGMTLGEIATWYKQTEFRKLELEVVRLDGWRPGLHFDVLSLPWIPPSPNMPTTRTALWYVGNCLFEGINMNEGRGTETPFEVVGAPWLDARKILTAIPESLAAGAHLEAIDYTPVPIPGKANAPRYQNTLCKGIRFQVADVESVRPFALAIGIIAAVRAIHPGELRWDGQPSFDTLLGGPEIRTAIESGAPPEEIVIRFGPSLRQFDRSRPRLYG